MFVLDKLEQRPLACQTKMKISLQNNDFDTYMYLTWLKDASRKNQYL